MDVCASLIFWESNRSACDFFWPSIDTRYVQTQRPLFILIFDFIEDSTILVNSSIYKHKSYYFAIETNTDCLRQMRNSSRFSHTKSDLYFNSINCSSIFTWVGGKFPPPKKHFVYFFFGVLLLYYF